MNKLKIGVIGTNFVADWLCECAAASGDVTVTAVYSRTAEKGQTFADKHGIPTVMTDREAFFSSDIDAVYIANPNALHDETAEAAMAHGKHVLVEKPAGLSAAQFGQMEETARRHGVVLMEAMRPGHDPAASVVRDALSEIGTIRRAVFDYCQYSSRYDAYKAGTILNAFDPSLGNAALMDIGCYAVHVCVMLFGRPTAITSRSVMLSNGMEGMGTALLDYPSMQAEIVYSKIADSVTPSVILGENGAITIERISQFERVTLERRKGEKTVLVEPRPENNMIYELADFAACIRGEQSDEPYRRNTRLTLEVMDEIRRQNGIVFPTE